VSATRGNTSPTLLAIQRGLRSSAGTGSAPTLPGAQRRDFQDAATANCAGRVAATAQVTSLCSTNAGDLLIKPTHPTNPRTSQYPNG